MTKKLLIFLGGMITIVFTLVFIPPLTRIIENMTAETNIDILLENVTEVTIDTVEVNTVELKLYYTPDNATFLQDNADDIYFYIPANTLTMSNLNWDYDNENNPFNVSLHGRVGGTDYHHYYAISNYYTYISTTDNNYTNFNLSMIQEGIIIKLSDILTIIGQDFTTYVASFNNTLPDRYYISLKYKVTGGSVLIDGIDNITYEKYIPAKISGTTATLLQTIPFILISAIVVTTTFLIKKEED